MQISRIQLSDSLTQVRVLIAKNRNSHNEKCFEQFKTRTSAHAVFITKVAHIESMATL